MHRSKSRQRIVNTPKLNNVAGIGRTTRPGHPRIALQGLLSSYSDAWRVYVFSVFDECLPLPARDERGEGWGVGSPNITRRFSLLSPTLASFGGGEGEENSATLSAYWGGGEPFASRRTNQSRRLPLRDGRGSLSLREGTAIELRSADFSPPRSSPAKTAGSGLKSALLSCRNSLNSMAVLPVPLPTRASRGEGENFWWLSQDAPDTT